MQLGFERREVWTLLYQRLLPPTFLPPPYSSHKLHDVSFKLVLKPKNFFSWLSHKEKNPTQCSAKSITRPLLPIEYLGQKRLEIYIPPPPPRQLRIGKYHILAFAQPHPRLFWGVWGGGGRLAVPFYSVQDCSQDYCERKDLYL